MTIGYFSLLDFSWNTAADRYGLLHPIMADLCDLNTEHEDLLMMTIMAFSIMEMFKQQLIKKANQATSRYEEF